MSCGSWIEYKVEVRDHDVPLWRTPRCDTGLLNLPLDGGIFVSCKTSHPAQLVYDNSKYYASLCPISGW